MHAANEILWMKIGNFIVIFYYYFPITFPEHGWPLYVTREPNYVFFVFLISSITNSLWKLSDRIWVPTLCWEHWTYTFCLASLLAWLDQRLGPCSNVSLQNKACELFPCYILEEVYIFLYPIEQIMGNTIILPYFSCFSCCEDTMVRTTRHDWHVSHAP